MQPWKREKLSRVELQGLAKCWQLPSTWPIAICPAQHQACAKSCVKKATRALRRAPTPRIRDPSETWPQVAAGVWAVWLSKTEFSSSPGSSHFPFASTATTHTRAPLGCITTLQVAESLKLHLPPASRQAIAATLSFRSRWAPGGPAAARLKPRTPAHHISTSKLTARRFLLKSRTSPRSTSQLAGLP